MKNMNCDSARLLRAGRSLRSRMLLLASLAFCVCLALGAFVHPAAAQQNAQEPLTNASVVKLIRAGFREKTVVAIIRSRPGRFDLAPDRLIELKRTGVGETIVLTLTGQGDSQIMSDEDRFE